MDSLLDESAVLGAGHALFVDAYARELEEIGMFSDVFGPGCAMETMVDRLPDEVILPIIWRYLGRIEGIWGFDVGLVFHHMGLTDPDDQEHALFDLMMGCQGAGISLADDHEEAFERACEILDPGNARDMDINPGDAWEMNEFTELAWSKVSEEYPESATQEEED